MIVLLPTIDEAAAILFRGYQVIIPGFLLTVFMEVLSINNTKKIIQQHGLEIYIQALGYNLINTFFLGAPCYVLGVFYFCAETKPNTTTWQQQTLSVFLLVFIHSICYYFIHKWFHENKTLYVMFHKFHHRFNTNVSPMIANAVTMGEFLFAYVAPIALGIILTQADEIALLRTLIILNVTNIFVHTPMLEEISIKYLPLWLVRTHDHLEHHRKVTVNYASPTFKIDYFIINFFFNVNKKW